MRKKKDELEESISVPPDAAPAGHPVALSQITALQEKEIKFASKPSLPFDQLKIKSSFSLNEVKNYGVSSGQQINAMVAEVSETKVLNAEVTLIDVKSSILRYADEKQNQGARQLATIFKTSEVTFADNMVTLTLNNETQKEQLLMIKQEFVDELRRLLQNTSVGLNIELSQAVTQVRAYKPHDVFKAMTEKNPALLELKKRFDLEIDY